MAWWDAEESIESYYGEAKRTGLFSKKCKIELTIYPSHIEGMGYDIYDDELSSETHAFNIPFNDILRVNINQVDNQKALVIEARSNSVVSGKNSTIALLGIEDIQKWYNLVADTHKQYVATKEHNEQLALEQEEEKKRISLKKEEEASKFYNECYAFHIKEFTPTYQLFAEKNKVALIYLDEGKSLNFLKIDGYEEEENDGIIDYKNIHYYEKAGTISYTTDIHGNYSSYGGSMTGGKFSKLATVGGGLLFGFMGMAMGAALTYKPAKQEESKTAFTIDSDVKKIDDRSVILNFYSDVKKQYIDIELPQDIYNFFQTYLPEKKYGIVDELEKKTVVHQSADMIESGSLLKSAVKQDTPSLEAKEVQTQISMEEFKQKVEKLKIMKEAGLLSDEKFAEEQAKLLSMI